MATYTPNYNLKKPSTSDTIKIADLNGNMDIVDSTMKTLSNDTTDLKSALNILTNAEQILAIPDTSTFVDGKFINKWNGQENDPGWEIITGITLQAGETITVYTKSYNTVSVIAKDNGGSSYTNLVNATDSTFKKYSYTTTESVNIALSVRKSTESVIFISKIDLPQIISGVQGSINSNFNILGYGEDICSFVQGVRRGEVNPYVIAQKNDRLTTQSYYMAKQGDIISVEGTYTGIRFIIIGGGTANYNSGWKTDDFTYEVVTPGVYYINVSKTNGTDSIIPSDVTFTARFISNSTNPNKAIKEIDETKSAINSRLFGDPISITYTTGGNKEYYIDVRKGDVITITNVGNYTISNCYLRDENGNNKWLANNLASGSSIQVIAGINYTKFTCSVTSNGGAISIILSNYEVGRIDSIDDALTVINKNILESGAWSGNSKSSDNKRIRCIDRIKVYEGTVFRLLNSALYYFVGIYETEETTTASESTGWIQGEYICKNSGYATVMIANGKTYGTSTAITVNDFGESFITVLKAAQQVNIEDLTYPGTPYYNKLAKYANYMYGDSETVAQTNFENFLWFTDPHTMYGNYTYDINNRTNGCINFDKYINELEFVYNSSPTDFVLCGGDWNDGGVPETELFKLSRAMEDCKAKLSPFYNCVGNHDTNYQYDSGSAQFSPDCLKNLWYRDQEHCYYTFTGKKTKFYVFDTQIESSDISDTYMTEQMKWFAHALESDNTAHIALAMHIYYKQETTVHSLANAVLDIACAYNARSTYTAYDGTTYNYSSATGKVEFVMAGHSHADYTVRHEASSVSIPIIATINAGRGEDSSYAGAEHCIFDLVNVDYDNRVVNLVRIGALGTDRVINIDANT